MQTSGDINVSAKKTAPVLNKKPKALPVNKNKMKVKRDAFGTTSWKAVRDGMKVIIET